jgi:hypothetical protein
MTAISVDTLLSARRLLKREQFDAIVRVGPCGEDPRITEHVQKSA